MGDIITLFMQLMTLGNFASSGERNFNIGITDSTSPTITFEEPPTPTNGSSTSSPVTVVANISDASNTSVMDGFR